jgi:hypothetical protein
MASYISFSYEKMTKSPHKNIYSNYQNSTNVYELVSRKFSLDALQLLCGRTT